MLKTALCCCGSTTIQVKGDPSLHVACHCNDCKKNLEVHLGCRLNLLHIQENELGLNYQH